MGRILDQILNVAELHLDMAAHWETPLRNFLDKFRASERERAESPWVFAHFPLDIE